MSVYREPDPVRIDEWRKEQEARRTPQWMRDVVADLLRQQEEMKKLSESVDAAICGERPAPWWRRIFR